MTSSDRDQKSSQPYTGPQLRCIFMGTPQYALEPLKALANASFVDVMTVVTRPDAVSGRGKKLIASPVKELATQLGIPVLETKTLRTEDVQNQLFELEPDVIIVCAYGAIVPDELLALAPMGVINIHASLLPRWRGAAPMQRAILAGDPIVGFSIMKIGHELDAGPWCVQRSVTTGEKNYDEISHELSIMGGQALVEVLEDWWVRGIAPQWMVQDPDRATYAPKIDKRELWLDPTAPAIDNMRRVQASSDEAPARCEVFGKPMRIMRAHVLSDQDASVLEAEAGQIICDGRLVLGCSQGALQILEVKPDGKRAMKADEFLAGIHDKNDATWKALS